MGERSEGDDGLVLVHVQEAKRLRPLRVADLNMVLSRAPNDKAAANILFTRLPRGE
jgi:hypothetical protein